jgi:PIN domain nuclease of toxin-antitoxin system
MRCGEAAAQHLHLPVGRARRRAPQQQRCGAVHDPANDVFLSSVSAWEIAVKHRLGKLPLSDIPAAYVPR